ncbi:MAG: precorrin-8X methylmutase [Acidimicrobiales bacterium]
MPMTVHPIEAESYAILARRIDLTHLAEGPRAVIERVIHASADFEFAGSMVVDRAAVDAGVRALRSGAPMITDVEMVRAGISGYPTVCLLSATPADPTGESTRSARAVRAASALYPDGAIWVVGCAPTALLEIVALTANGTIRPALVIGLPVGFVGAAESKEAARRLDVPTITNVGEKGGSAVAAAACNALIRRAAR